MSEVNMQARMAGLRIENRMAREGDAELVRENCGCLVCCLIPPVTLGQQVRLERVR